MYFVRYNKEEPSFFYKKIKIEKVRRIISFEAQRSIRQGDDKPRGAICDKEEKSFVQSPVSKISPFLPCLSLDYG